MIKPRMNQLATRMIALAESDDENGTVLRAHLLTEGILVDYISYKRVSEIKPYVRMPRDFSGKLSLSVAFGLPPRFAAVAHQLNVIRNGMAHGEDEALRPDQLEELTRKVRALAEPDSLAVTLERQFLQMPLKGSGEPLLFGKHGSKVDFVIAFGEFYRRSWLWLVAEMGIRKEPGIAT